MSWRPDEARSEAHTIADVRAGRIEFALVAARAFDRLGVDAFSPLLAPFALESLEAQRRALAGSFPERALPALARLGVVGVAVLPGELRHPVGLTRPLVRPEDFAGARVGIRDSALAERTFATLGAKVELLGDHFGGFDGVEGDLQVIENNRLAAQVALNVTLWPRIMVLVANRGAWERLDAGRRRLLQAAGRAALPAAIESLRRSQADAHAVLCRRGNVSFTLASPAEVDALRRALAPVSDGLDQPEIGRARGAAEPVPAPCPRAAGAAAADSAALDGVWTFDSDEADLRATHVGIDIIPENWGHHVLVVAGGRFVVSQENGQSCTWAFGRSTVRGDRLIWDVIDGGGRGPNNAFNRPGEHFEYVWSRFKDTLRLTLAPGAAPAVNFIARPWRRLGDDPRDAPFSPRCPPPRSR